MGSWGRLLQLGGGAQSHAGQGARCRLRAGLGAVRSVLLPPSELGRAAGLGELPARAWGYSSWVTQGSGQKAPAV